MLRRPNQSALIENLEDRRLMAASPAVVIGIKIAKRADVDATALNSNRITIAFDRTIRLLDPSKIRSFGYAEDLLNPGQQRKVTVGMTITQDQASPTVLTIITDRLIRKGSRIFLELGAVTDTKARDIVFDGSSAAKTITFTKGQNKPRYTMSNRNWRATDLSYFTKDVFSSAPTPTTANVEPNATTVRNNLSTFLNAKVSKGILTTEQAAAALARYDSSAASIPSANLRAALISLTGTVAEPAIDSYLTKNNVTGKLYSFIGFGNLGATTAPVSETKLNASGRLQLIVRDTFAGEDFRALSAVFAHEAIHQDTVADSQGSTQDTQDEEIVANAVQANVYSQQALVNNSFVGNGTKLVNKFNEQVLALLNSGDKLFPYGGILRAPAINNDGNVFVGAKTDPGTFGNNTTVKSFEDWIRREYVSRGFSSGGTPTNAVGVAILKNIVGVNGNFTLHGIDVQDYLDTRNLVLTDVAYVKLAQALKLTY